MKRLLYVLILALILTACGKAETKKEQNGTNKEEKKVSETETETMKEEENSTSNQGESSQNLTNNSGQNSSQTSNPKAETSTHNTGEEPSKNTPQNSGQESSNHASQNSGQESSNHASQNSGQNANKNPSTDSNTAPVKKPVKRVSEEVKSAEVPYKYGVTKYDVTTNYYTLYSDDSKELIDSSSYTVYNSSNYSATDIQLQSEAEVNAAKYQSYYQEILRLVNEIRADAGVAPLTLDVTLCKAANMRALEMDYSNEMSHTRPNGKDCFSVLDFYKISFGTCGENIAAGQTSASSVVNGWKNSPGHYQNMINASFTKLGVGYSTSGVGDYGHYWCQLFTN